MLIEVQIGIAVLSVLVICCGFCIYLQHARIDRLKQLLRTEIEMNEEANEDRVKKTQQLSDANKELVKVKDVLDSILVHVNDNMLSDEWTTEHPDSPGTYFGVNTYRQAKGIAPMELQKNVYIVMLYGRSPCLQSKTLVFSESFDSLKTVSLKTTRDIQYWKPIAQILDLDAIEHVQAKEKVNDR